MDTSTITLKVFAKINLSLNILGAENGMHSLDMVMTSVDIADVISVSKSKRRQNSVEFFPPIEGLNGSDTVTKTLDKISTLFDEVFVDVKVTKGIPFSGGLGGSSADAAGVIVAIDYLADLKKRGCNLVSTASSVGSDVPYMLKGGFARVLNNGNDVKNLNFFKQICLVICQDRFGVSTSSAYKKFDEIYPSKRLVLSDNDALINALKNGGEFDYLDYIDNALFEPAVRLEPSILTTLKALDSEGSVKSFMTGSGSACVGIFKDIEGARAAENKLRSRGYYAKACSTVPNGIEFL